MVIVDTRTAEEYAAGHVDGAVNIPTEEIVINVPVKNMLTSKKKIEKVMGGSGIGNDTLVLAYDANKMGASRLLWSLFMYGHQNVKVIDGGFDAIQKSGIALNTDVPEPKPAVFTAKEPTRNCWPSNGWMSESRIEKPDSHRDTVGCAYIGGIC